MDLTFLQKGFLRKITNLGSKIQILPTWSMKCLKILELVMWLQVEGELAIALL
jgi:hypothetical protein